MFQIIAGCVSNPTPERHETRVDTFGPHKILQTPSIGSGIGLSQTREVIPKKDFVYSCFGRIRNGPTTCRASIKLLILSGPRRGQGRHSSCNYIHRLQLKGFGPEADLEYRAHQVPQYQELIAAYRAQRRLEKITPPPNNKRKHLALKDGNFLGSDTAPKYDSPDSFSD